MIDHSTASGVGKNLQSARVRNRSWSLTSIAVNVTPVSSQSCVRKHQFLGMPGWISGGGNDRCCIFRLDQGCGQLLGTVIRVRTHLRGIGLLTVVVRSGLWVTGAICAPGWLDDAVPLAAPRQWYRGKRTPGLLSTCERCSPPARSSGPVGEWRRSSLGGIWPGRRRPPT